VLVIRDRCLKLLRLFCSDVRKSFTKLGRELGLSHTAVRKCYLKLLELGIMKPTTLVNYRAFELRLLLLTLLMSKLPEWLTSCPRILLFCTVDDGANLALVLAESWKVREVLEKRSCSITSSNWVREVRINEVRRLLPQYVYPKFLEVGSEEVCPCGQRCDQCPEYDLGCPGCPATVWYRGVLRN